MRRRIGNSGPDGPVSFGRAPALAGLVLCALALAGLTTAAKAFQTERVVLVVMDGVRDSEGFEDPSHANIPHIWNELRPRGYVSHSFYNSGFTVTVPGHATMTTGTLQWLDDSGAQRPDRPLLWEYLRDQTGLPEDAALIVSNKDKLHALSYSLYPGYGPADSAHVIAPTYEDGWCLQNFLSYAAQHHPVVSLVAFGETDIRAHECDSTGYLAAIQEADSLTAYLWNWLQSDPFYANRTALFLTNDHGRHLDDWCNHGDSCAGCRHVSFLALGPDFLSGVETVSPVGDLKDIAVTAAALLGLHTPLAEGRMLRELLADPTQVNPVQPGTRPRLRLAVQPCPARSAATLRLLGPERAAGDPGGASGRRWRAFLFDPAGRRIWREELSEAQLREGLALAPPGGSTVLCRLVLRAINDPGAPVLSAPVLWIR